LLSYAKSYIIAVFCLKGDFTLEKTKKNTALKWTILLIALTQMPQLALTPATEQIRSFFGRELAEVQTAMSMTNFISVLTSILVAFLVNRALITKKLSVVLGQLFLGTAAVFALLFHAQFWSLYCLSIIIGLATGCFVTSTFGLLFDNFEPEERQKLAGYQTSFINAGGIAFSLLGGLLAGLFWYGGYLVFFICIVVAVIGIFTIPSYKTPAKKSDGTPRKKIDSRVYYYAVCVFFFMMLYNTCGANISSHIRDSFVNYSSVAGLANALMMTGGAVAGIFFGRISKKLNDMILVLACGFLFAGYMLLSFNQSSLIFILISVFLAGCSLSFFLPRCIYGVSTYSDPTNSALTTLIISSVAPSMGGFANPIIITRITNALSPASTAFRYRFAGCTVLVLGIIIAIVTLTRSRKKA
jgi:MFS family permease